MEVRLLSDKDHEVLGLEYCPGYTDSFGKWNTGFYCPSLGNEEPVYCCGTVTYKYCCTKRDREHSPEPDQTFILAIALGLLLVISLLTLVSCFFCQRCLFNKRRHTATNGGPLYRLHCSSTTSGVANMYSFSGQNSAATTPVDGIEPHVLRDIASRRSHILTSRVPTFSAAVAQSTVPNLTEDSVHNDPPPPYNTDSPRSSLLLAEQDPFYSSVSSPSTTSFTQSQPPRTLHGSQSPDISHSLQSSHTSVSSTQLQGSTAAENNSLYWSTKF
ncbi:membrane protein FAM159A-like [Limulus polyphemus]|uniref:Membrane protein FAM159A-like n=1 Tax=Limulus polyphemus TaxID=6850 RepID=A0ABM1BK22_LIMPO|nr:membrane protein FAM159A-like [Limulus polyphemus]XP_013783536.1 membrane protein FAM159A-like [Limulus polyphemus]